MNLIRNSATFLVVFLFLSALVTETSFASHGGEDAKVAKRTLVEGSGPAAVRHSTLKVHYTGWLEDGTQFDSSLTGNKKPFDMKIGTGQVIPGWEKGLLGTRLGEKVELIIPPELAYGDRGAGNLIPPNAILRFEIEVLEITPPRYHNISNSELQKLLGEGVKLLDIRRPEEWSGTGIVEGSILLTAFNKNGDLVPGFPNQLKEMVRLDEKVILICRTGNRTSVIAEAITAQVGYKQVYNVKDGISRWIKEKNPVIKP